MLKKSYLIGNAHIDPIWLWDWQEGCTEVRNTFRSALDRLNEFDGWIFTSSAVRYYSWIERFEPSMFAEISERVREGRWCIAGGWWIQPDCNLPSGESFCRQSLYGQRYFLEKFGKIAKTGYNVDSFGHNAGLVQILQKSGLENYVFSRPGAHESDFPSLFDWVGEDGSRVRAGRIPIGYESNSLPELKEKVTKFEKIRAESPVELMLFYGVGNHGGGPTIEMLSWLDKVKEKKNFVFSSVDEYFDRTRDVAVPEVRGDLGKHAAGCYSAVSDIKKGNRRAENRLLSAEKFASLANHLLGTPYPKEKLRGAWETLLFHQFHDCLGGCSVRSACEEAVGAFSRTVSEADEVINDALQRIAARVDTCCGQDPVTAKDKLGKPVIVFNPHPFPAVFTVRVPRLFVRPDRKERFYEAYSTDGICVPVQLVQGQNLFWHTKDGVFRAPVPAFGYRLFYVRESLTALPKDSCVRIEEESVPPLTFNYIGGAYYLENEKIAAKFDKKSGLLIELKDKKNGESVLGGGVRFIVCDDRNVDTWGHSAAADAWKESNRLGVWGFCDNRLGEQIGEFICTALRVEEQGPVRSVIRGFYRYGSSEIICDYILYPDSDSLETEVRINWQEKQQTARMYFPLTVKQARAEVSYGHIAKKVSGEEDFAHKWLDVGTKLAGLTIWNDSTYSYRLSDDGVSAVLARSAIYADHAGIREEGAVYDYMDQGNRTLRFLVRPRRAADYAEISARGHLFNENCFCIWEGYHGGDLPVRMSFAKVSEGGILLRALKRAEDDGGYVFRAYETRGVPGKCTVTLFGKTCELSFGAYEIKTVCLSDDGNFTERNILEFNI